MDYKEQLRILKEIVEIASRASGRALTPEDFAAGVGAKNTDYWYQLIGKSGKVNEKHILKFKDFFKKELNLIGVPLPGEAISESKSLLLAIFDDYCERMSQIEKVEKKIVRARIMSKATQFSDASVGEDPQR